MFSEENMFELLKDIENLVKNNLDCLQLFIEYLFIDSIFWFAGRSILVFTTFSAKVILTAN